MLILLGHILYCDKNNSCSFVILWMINTCNKKQIGNLIGRGWRYIGQCILRFGRSNPILDSVFVIPDIWFPTGPLIRRQALMGSYLWIQYHHGTTTSSDIPTSIWHSDRVTVDECNTVLRNSHNCHCMHNVCDDICMVGRFVIEPRQSLRSITHS